MCGENFWKRVIVFCLTFGLGVLVSGLFITSETQQQNVIRSGLVQIDTIQPKALFDPKELNKNSTPKPLCKQYGKNEFSELRVVHEKLKKFLEDNKNISAETRETCLKKIVDIEKRLINSLKKPPKKQNTLPSESKPTHNLLFVPTWSAW